MTAYNTSMQVSWVTQSGVTEIDALLGGRKWGGGAGSEASVAFSFPWTTNNTAQWYEDATGNYSTLDEPFATSHYGLDTTQVQAARAALQSWGNVANVQFQEIPETGTNVGDIRFAWTSAYTGPTEWGHAQYPLSEFAPGGDIWIYSGMRNPSTDWSAGSFNYMSLIHEIGHALGLKHPGNYGSAYPPYLPSSLDERGLTVMSYTSVVGYPDSTLSFYPTTPMAFDIAALQYLYGPNMTYHSGNDTYDFRSDQDYFQTIWDSGGIDTIQYATSFTGGKIDLRPAHWSQLGVQRTISPTSGGQLTSPDTIYIYGTVTIENAIGGDGADTIIGNDAANSLVGGGGNDTIQGGTGADSIYGGLGNDTLDGGVGADTAVYSSGVRANYIVPGNAPGIVNGPEGIDTVLSIERYQFPDRNLAFDLDLGASAGNTVRIIGAAFNAPAIQQHPDWVGAGVDMFDGGQSMLQVCGLVAQIVGLNNTGLVTAVFTNVVGSAPDTATRNGFLSLLQGNGGSMTQAQFLEMAASHPVNEVNINLVGMQQFGVEFT